MKIIRQTPDRLIIGQTPWRLGAALCALVLVSLALGAMLRWMGRSEGTLIAVIGGGGGLIALAICAERLRMELDARANAFILHRRRGLRRSEMRHALSDLSCAVLEEDRGDPARPRYSTTVVFSRGIGAGRYPLTDRARPEIAAEVIETVNLWLHQARRLPPGT